MRNHFENEISQLSELIKSAPWEDQTFYGCWLQQQTYLVENTSRLICLSAAHTSLTRSTLFNEWLHHLKGEMNHDLVAKSDLKNLGMSPTKTPLAPIEILLNLQFHSIPQSQGASLFGYALLLEGLACLVAPAILSRMEKAYRPQQYRFLSLHAKVDQDHYREGIEVLSQLTHEESLSVLQNLKLTAYLYKHTLLELLNSADKKPISAPERAA